MRNMKIPMRYHGVIHDGLYMNMIFRNRVVMVCGGVIGVVFATLFVFCWFEQLSNDADDRVLLPEAVETSIVDLEDGDTVEMTAEVVRKTIGNREYAMLAYNRSIPGPILRVPQGANISMVFTNNTSMETLLHSHGLRLDNTFDGTHFVQDAIAPGEVFTYALTFPDAGMFWYHPHVREDSAQDLGLYGNYFVTPQEEGYWSPVNQEIPLFVDDLRIENGEIVPYGDEDANFALMGRYGNVMLVNGDTDYQLDVRPGEVVRFFMTNAANARPFLLAFSGGAIMKLVGADASAYERETWQSAITIGPSERVVIEVLFPESGSYKLQNITPESTTTIGTIVATGDIASPSYATDFTTLHEHKSVIADIDRLRSLFDKPVDKSLRLTVDMNMSMQNMMNDGSHSMGGGMMIGGSEDGIEWDEPSSAMNAVSDISMLDWNLIDTGTGKKNMNIDDWNFSVGDIVKIRIDNTESSMHSMQHPIHFHGQRFLILSHDGIAETNMAWKDTVLIPSGETVDILLEVTNPGEWMAHCHIAEHVEAGMMLPFTVVQ
jgi:FtsP/CotA-like multicopper oxidase with cupredoxin domain